MKKEEIILFLKVTGFIFLISILGKEHFVKLWEYGNEKYHSQAQKISYPHPRNCALPTESLFKSLMYSHPDDSDILGRPFSGLKTHEHILQAYLDVPEIELPEYNPDLLSKLNKIEDVKDPLLKKILNPMLITGLSSNHFKEHLASISHLFHTYPDSKKVMVYDFGLEDSEVDYLKHGPNAHRYIYRKYDFNKYPNHTYWLTNAAFKLLAVTECLLENPSCMWFDTSIVHQKDFTNLLYKFVVGKNAPLIYYINTAAHNTAGATHPIMFAYLPSNISYFNQEKQRQAQSGAFYVLNTREVKQQIWQYVIACSLTQECIAPNYELTEVRLKEFNSKTNPWGNFEFRKCRFNGRPFVCHRYDQSVLDILVNNFYQYNVPRFIIGGKGSFGYLDRHVIDHPYGWNLEPKTDDNKT